MPRGSIEVPIKRVDRKHEIPNNPERLLLEKRGPRKKRVRPYWKLMDRTHWKW